MLVGFSRTFTSHHLHGLTCHIICSYFITCVLRWLAVYASAEYAENEHNMHPFSKKDTKVGLDLRLASHLPSRAGGCNQVTARITDRTL